MTAPSGSTLLAAVIGSPVRHSLSPALHNAAFADSGLDWTYVAFEVADGDAVGALGAMRSLGIRGLSVTMPHKTAVAGACDELSDDAAALRSVNCVSVLGDGRLRGDSTDGEGFLRSLDDARVAVAGAKVALLGAGGAARAVAQALVRRGAAVTVAARRPEASRAVTNIIPDVLTTDWADRDDLVRRSDVVVNCTPIGMLGDQGLPCDSAALQRDQCVVDLVYRPLRTPLLATAAAVGATTVDGLGMLVHQAALAFEIWTGVVPSLEVMRAAALATLAI